MILIVGDLKQAVIMSSIGLSEKVNIASVMLSTPHSHENTLLISFIITKLAALSLSFTNSILFIF